MSKTGRDIAPVNQVPATTSGRARVVYYQPAFCEVVIEHGRRGKLTAEIAHELGVTGRTVRNWRQRHSEFDHAMRLAHGAAQAWWEKRVRDNIDNPKFRTNMALKVLSQHFGHDWGRTANSNLHPPFGRDPIVEDAANTVAAAVEDAAGSIYEMDEDQAAKRIQYLTELALGRAEADKESEPKDVSES